MSYELDASGAQRVVGYFEQIGRHLRRREQRESFAMYAFGILGDTARLLLGAADGFGGDALAVGHPHGKHRGGRHQADGEVDEETGN